MLVGPSNDERGLPTHAGWSYASILMLIVACALSVTNTEAKSDETNVAIISSQSGVCASENASGVVDAFQNLAAEFKFRSHSYDAQCERSLVSHHIAKGIQLENVTFFFIWSSNEILSVVARNKLNDYPDIASIIFISDDLARSTFAAEASVNAWKATAAVKHASKAARDNFLEQRFFEMMQR